MAWRMRKVFKHFLKVRRALSQQKRKISRAGVLSCKAPQKSSDCDVQCVWSFRHHSPEKGWNFPFKLQNNGADISSPTASPDDVQ
jgi:hypothetical protein